MRLHSSNTFGHWIVSTNDMNTSDALLNIVCRCAFAGCISVLYIIILAVLISQKPQSLIPQLAFMILLSYGMIYAKIK